MGAPTTGTAPPEAASPSSTTDSAAQPYRADTDAQAASSTTRPPLSPLPRRTAVSDPPRFPPPSRTKHLTEPTSSHAFESTLPLPSSLILAPDPLQEPGRRALDDFRVAAAPDGEPPDGGGRREGFYRVESSRGTVDDVEERVDEVARAYAEDRRARGLTLDGVELSLSLHTGSALVHPRDWSGEVWAGRHGVEEGRDRLLRGGVSEVLLVGDTSLGCNLPGLAALLEPNPRATLTILRVGLPTRTFAAVTALPLLREAEERLVADEGLRLTGHDAWEALPVFSLSALQHVQWAQSQEEQAEPGSDEREAKGWIASLLRGWFKREGERLLARSDLKEHYRRPTRAAAPAPPRLVANLAPVSALAARLDAAPKGLLPPPRAPFDPAGTFAPRACATCGSTTSGELIIHRGSTVPVCVACRHLPQDGPQRHADVEEAIRVAKQNRTDCENEACDHNSSSARLIVCVDGKTRCRRCQQFLISTYNATGILRRDGGWLEWSPSLNVCLNCSSPLNSTRKLAADGEHARCSWCHASIQADGFEWDEERACDWEGCKEKRIDTSSQWTRTPVNGISIALCPRHYKKIGYEREKERKNTTSTSAVPPSSSAAVARPSSSTASHLPPPPSTRLDRDQASHKNAYALGEPQQTAHDPAGLVLVGPAQPEPVSSRSAAALLHEDEMSEVDQLASDYSEDDQPARYPTKRSLPGQPQSRSRPAYTTKRSSSLAAAEGKGPSLVIDEVQDSPVVSDSEAEGPSYSVGREVSPSSLVAAAAAGDASLVGSVVRSSPGVAYTSVLSSRAKGKGKKALAADDDPELDLPAVALPAVRSRKTSSLAVVPPDSLRKASSSSSRITSRPKLKRSARTVPDSEDDEPAGQQLYASAAIASSSRSATQPRPVAGKERRASASAPVVEQDEDGQEDESDFDNSDLKDASAPTVKPAIPCFNCTVPLSGMQAIRLPLGERDGVNDVRRCCAFCKSHFAKLGTWWDPDDTCAREGCNATRPLVWTSGRKFTIETQEHFPEPGMYCSACKQHFFKKFKKANDALKAAGKAPMPTQRELARDATNAAGGPHKKRRKLERDARDAEKAAGGDAAGPSDGRSGQEKKEKRAKMSRY